MSGPREEANVAHLPVATMGTAEAVLLHVGNAFHDESNGKQHDP